jgi:hypothetical protein
MNRYHTSPQIVFIFIDVIIFLGPHMALHGYVQFCLMYRVVPIFAATDVAIRPDQ